MRLLSCRIPQYHLSSGLPVDADVSTIRIRAMSLNLLQLEFRSRVTIFQLQTSLANIHAAEHGNLDCRGNVLRFIYPLNDLIPNF